MADGISPLEKKKRPQGATAAAEDVAAWTEPEVTEAAIGTRTAHGKKLRRVMRDAGSRLRDAAEGSGETPTTDVTDSPTGTSTGPKEDR